MKIAMCRYFSRRMLANVLFAFHYPRTRTMSQDHMGLQPIGLALTLHLSTGRTADRLPGWTTRPEVQRRPSHVFDG